MATRAKSRETAPAAANDNEPQPFGNDEIVYVPSDGDPHTVRVGGNVGANGKVVGGVEFKANVPQIVSRRTTVMQLLVQERELKDGTIVTQGVERRVPMADALKSNPRFQVNGVKVEAKEGTARVPDNPDTYRGYAQRWIWGSESASELKLRWEAEHALREMCGVTETDLARIMPFYEARYEQLQAVA